MMDGVGATKRCQGAAPRPDTTMLNGGQRRRRPAQGSVGVISGEEGGVRGQWRWTVERKKRFSKHMVDIVEMMRRWRHTQRHKGHNSATYEYTYTTTE